LEPPLEKPKLREDLKLLQQYDQLDTRINDVDDTCTIFANSFGESGAIRINDNLPITDRLTSILTGKESDGQSQPH
jgi:hypothetical protein